MTCRDTPGNSDHYLATASRGCGGLGLATVGSLGVSAGRVAGVRSAFGSGEFAGSADSVQDRHRILRQVQLRCPEVLAQMREGGGAWYQENVC